MMAALRMLSACAAALLLIACTPLIAGYSLQAYQNATTLKADVAALVDKSTDDYDAHASEVTAMTLRMNEAYEFSKGEPYNAISTKQWALMLDPSQAAYAGFVKKWHDDHHLSQTEAGNLKAVLDRDFDEIICLEANKQQATKCAPKEALPGQSS